MSGQTASGEDLNRLVDKQESLIRFVTYAALIPVVLLFSFTFFFYYRRKRESDFRERELELKFARTEMEMRALRAQVNPHFIFNSLNSIQHFIHHNDNAQAERYLIKFSRLIRMVLENSVHPFISLEDDLNILELYIELEAIRLTDGFDYEIKLAPGIQSEEVYVPPMLLQPLVENAIWHGLSNRPKPPRSLIISFEYHGDKLMAEVLDNGRKLNLRQPHKGKSFGLSLVKERIALIGGMEADAVLDLVELKDEEGNNSGTQVKLLIPTE